MSRSPLAPLSSTSRPVFLSALLPSPSFISPNRNIEIDMGRSSGAKASVFYGITASAPSVFAAIAAWPQVVGVLRFVDLILLRRQKGTLHSSSPPSRIASIPPEVWRQILGDLVSAEVEKAGLELLRSLFCYEHEIQVSRFKTNGELPSWEEYYRVMKDCYECSDSWTNLDRRLGDESKALFAHFGLRLHCKEVLAVWDQGRHFVLPIAIPSHLGRPAWWDKDSTTVDADPGHDEADPSEIVDLDFALPANVDDRFVHIARTFALDVLQCNTNSLTTGSRKIEAQQQPSGGESEIEEKTESQEESVKPPSQTDKVKPGWKLWLSAWYDE